MGYGTGTYHWYLDFTCSYSYRLRPNMEGIPSTHIFNYDESPVKDDPGAEDAFFSKNQKYTEQVWYLGTGTYRTVP
jgi:hypothetical protein